MQIYLVTDKNKRVHQFIYPDRVWEQAESGDWFTRSLSLQDHKQRLSVCKKLVKHAVSAHRLNSAPETEEPHVIH